MKKQSYIGIFITIILALVVVEYGIPIIRREIQLIPIRKRTKRIVREIFEAEKLEVEKLEADSLDPLSQPLLGIYLGETIQEAEKRLGTKFNLYWPDSDTRIVKSHGLKNEVGLLKVEVCESLGQIQSVMMYFTDTIFAKYETIKTFLQKKYLDTDWKQDHYGFQFTGCIKIDEVDVSVDLYSSMLGSTLWLSYDHGPLIRVSDKELYLQTIEDTERELSE